jgi:hypothetical protein
VLRTVANLEGIELLKIVRRRAQLPFLLQKPASLLCFSKYPKNSC